MLREPMPQETHGGQLTIAASFLEIGNPTTHAYQKGIRFRQFIEKALEYPQPQTLRSQPPGLDPNA